MNKAKGGKLQKQVKRNGHRKVTADGVHLNATSDPRVLEVARWARMRLLQLRLELFQTASVPKIAFEAKLSGRPLDLYRALALPFDQHQAMCDGLASLIVQQGNFQVAGLSPAQTSALRVLYVYIHKLPDAPGFFMSTLTADVNADLANGGETCRVNQRKLGNILTSLSFTHRTRKNTGYVVWLERADLERLHASARQYGVAEIDSDLRGTCELCVQASAPPPNSAPAKFHEEESEDSKSEGRERQTYVTRLPVGASKRRGGGIVR